MAYGTRSTQQRDNNYVMLDRISWSLIVYSRPSRRAQTTAGKTTHSPPSQHVVASHPSRSVPAIVPHGTSSLSATGTDPVGHRLAPVLASTNESQYSARTGGLYNRAKTTRQPLAIGSLRKIQCQRLSARAHYPIHGWSFPKETQHQALPFNIRQDYPEIPRGSKSMAAYLCLVFGYLLDAVDEYTKLTALHRGLHGL